MGLVKRMIKQIRKSLGSGKKRTLKKTLKKNNIQKAGAVYSFDLNDKIGGQAANVALNGTPDGDCPSGNLKDLGMINYENAVGGKRKGKHNKTRKHSNKHTNKHNTNHKNKKSHKNNNKNQPKQNSRKSKSNKSNKKNNNNHNKSLNNCIRVWLLV